MKQLKFAFFDRDFVEIMFVFYYIARVSESLLCETVDRDSVCCCKNVINRRIGE